MNRPRLLYALALVAALVTSCGAAEPKPPPTVIAQGFDLETPREATAGGFSDVRLRFEVPAGIEHLVIRERSYEIDLAKSPEVSHFQLFGIERRVWSKRDVTLDFSGYLNDKIERPGDYVLEVELVDRDAQSAGARLQVVVVAPPDEASPESGADAETGTDTDAGSAASEELSDASHDAPGLGEERPFRLQRVGAGPVEGGDHFGITWTTVEAIDVVIRVVPRDDEPARLARLGPGIYEKGATRGDLGRALDRLELADTLEIPTANDAAAGAVLAVVRPNERYVLHTDRSTTSLSELGTTVTLSGRYREATGSH